MDVYLCHWHFFPHVSNIKIRKWICGCSCVLISFLFRYARAAVSSPIRVLILVLMTNDTWTSLEKFRFESLSFSLSLPLSFSYNWIITMRFPSTFPRSNFITILYFWVMGNTPAFAIAHAHAHTTHIVTYNQFILFSIRSTSLTSLISFVLHFWAFRFLGKHCRSKKSS